MKFIIKLMATLALAASVHAQPVRIVTNIPVGSAPDTVARKLADVLSTKWKTTVIVENRTGAAGVIALEYYLSEPADGSTILMLDSGAWSTMPILYNKEDKLARLAPLTPLYSNDWVVVANNKIRTLDELRAAVRAKPFYGSWGIGSAGHLCGIEVARVLGVPATHVPYKEYGQWFADIVNGEVPFSCSSIGSTEQYRNSGKLNWLALTSDRRDAGFTDLPTTREYFGPTFYMSGGYITFFIHDAAPSTKIRMMRNDIAQTMRGPDMREATQAVRGKVWPGTTDEFTQFISKTIEYNRSLIKKYDIRVN
jgi:tripartite-type tricarboxylate transporter receptor subunit TctC